MESCTQALCDLALRFGEDDDEESGSMVGLSACGEGCSLASSAGLSQDGAAEPALRRGAAHCRLGRG